MASLLSGFSLDPLDAPQRHCFHDSDDEDEVPQTFESPESLFTVETASKASVDLLVIGTSPITCKFLSSHVITEAHTCSTVKTHDSLKVLKGRYFPSNSDRDLNPAIETIISKIYKAKDNEGTLICTNEESLKEDYANGWSQKILETLRPRTVIIVHCQPLHMYYSYGTQLDEGVDSHLKGLVTSCWTSEPLCDFLPQSNVIGGEPAAIMTHCQLYGVPAAMASLYVSSSLTIKEQVNCYTPLLTHPLLSTSMSIRDPKEVEKLLSSDSPKPRTDVELLYT